VSWKEYALAVPTIASPSNAARLRSNSKITRSWSMASAGHALSLNARVGTSLKASNSSGVMGRRG